MNYLNIEHTSSAMPFMQNNSGKLLNPISINLRSNNWTVFMSFQSYDIGLLFTRKELSRTFCWYLFELNLDSTSIYMTLPPKPP